MKHKLAVPDGLQDLISAQSGMFSHQQAMDNGATRAAMRRWAREGRWHSKGRNLWSLSKDPDFKALAWGGVLLGGDGAAIGGKAAASLWGFAPEPAQIDVWTVGRARQREGGRWRFRHGRRPRTHEPPRTTLEQTVLDLCAEARDADEVVGWITKALSKTKLTRSSLLGHTRNSRTQPHRALILDILSEGEAGIESPLERRYLHDVEIAHGLPVGTRQVRASSRRRTDVGYMEFHLLVELDGETHHRGLAAQQDMDRDNEHRLLGLITLRFGWSAVAGNPCKVARQVATVLRQHGWKGQLANCPRCRGRRS
ncbi:DUF559 domain-containing protein [Tessaracoccus terricola]